MVGTGQKIIAIDPGTEHSGVVWYDPCARRVTNAEDLRNDAILDRLRVVVDPSRALIIEDIESFGLAVGKETFATCRWIGRFQEAFESRGGSVRLIGRRNVKIVLCGASTYRDPGTGAQRKVGDAEIRRALLDRFPGTGGGKTPAVGTKAQPGPLYGVSGHMWSALALAVTACEVNP